MNRYQLVTLALAIGVAACFAGVGIAIAERSWIGVIACSVGSVLLMGAGFRYKKKHLR
jgi:arginine exporter protein ArgO